MPPSISGGTSSGRSTPLTVTVGLPTVTRTSAPGLAASTVLVFGSYETVAPVCSNIERNGIRSVPLRTIAASTRSRLTSLSGLA